MDGRAWPVQSSRDVLVPSGKHTLTPAVTPAPVLLTDFNGEIRSAVSTPSSTEVAYFSRSRTIAVLAKPVSSIEVDGAQLQNPDRQGAAVLLPVGQHVVTFSR